MADKPKVTGAAMPQKRARVPLKIFVIAGIDAVTEFENIDKASKSIIGKEVVVIRGHRLEQKVTYKFV